MTDLFHYSVFNPHNSAASVYPILFNSCRTPAAEVCICEFFWHFFSEKPLITEYKALVRLSSFVIVITRFYYFYSHYELFLWLLLLVIMIILLVLAILLTTFIIQQTFFKCVPIFQIWCTLLSTHHKLWIQDQETNKNWRNCIFLIYTTSLSIALTHTDTIRGGNL